MWDRVRASIAERVAVDRRALAAMRVLVGVVLVVDLTLRTRFLRAFYTDAGLLPRATLRAVRPGFADLSLHALSGSFWWQATLFAVLIGCGVAVAVGYRTRLAVVASFLLLASTQLRNTILLNGGDSLLLRLLLWGAFLPLGTRWSLDAVRRTDDDVGTTDAAGVTSVGRRVASVASAGVLLQVVLVYATNAVVKLRGEAWPSGVAIRHVFQLDRFTILAGELLAGEATLLSLLGWAWLASLIASPLLLIVTGRARSLVAGALLGGHLGMLATMWLGVFPLVSVAGLLPFLHSGVWDRVERLVRPVARSAAGFAERLQSPGSLGGRSGADDTRRATRDSGRPRAEPDGGRRRRAGRGAARTLAVVLVVGMLAWNAVALGVVSADGAAPVDPSNNRWDMFAPAPPQEAVWFTAPAVTTDGQRVDAYAGEALDRSRPAEITTTYPSVRWRKYMIAVWWENDDRLRHAAAAYFCDRWNRTHESNLRSLTLVANAEPTRFGESEPVDRHELVTHECGRG